MKINFLSKAKRIGTYQGQCHEQFPSMGVLHIITYGSSENEPSTEKKKKKKKRCDLV